LDRVLKLLGEIPIMEPKIFYENEYEVGRKILLPEFDFLKK